MSPEPVETVQVRVLEGRIAFWSAASGRLEADLLAWPAGESGAAGLPVTVDAPLVWPALDWAIACGLDRWASEGGTVRLEIEPGRDGALRVSMEGGPVRLTLHPARVRPSELAFPASPLPGAVA